MKRREWMKLLLMCMMAAVLVIGMSACGSSSQGSDEETAAQTQESEAAEDAETEAEAGSEDAAAEAEKAPDFEAELADGTHWEKRSPVPGKARTLAATAATDNYIYLAAGIHYGGVNTTGDVLRDVRRYDPLTDRWQYVAVLPQGLLNHVCFAIGKNVYIGLGETENWNVTDKLYRIEE